MLQPPLMKKMPLMTLLSLASYQGWLHACPICTVAAWLLSEERQSGFPPLLSPSGNSERFHPWTCIVFWEGISRATGVVGKQRQHLFHACPLFLAAPSAQGTVDAPRTQKSGGQNVWEFSKTQKVCKVTVLTTELVGKTTDSLERLKMMEKKERRRWGHLQFLFLWGLDVKVPQSCLTFCDPMDCSPTGSSIHGISQERILEWIAISFSRGSSWPRDQTQVSFIAEILYLLSHQESPWYLYSSVKWRLQLLVDHLCFTRWNINYELVFFSISVALVKMKYLWMYKPRN